MQSPKKTPIHDSLMQRIARHAMLVMCGILAVGIAFVAATSGRAYASPAPVRFVRDAEPARQHGPALDALSAMDADSLAEMAPSIEPAPAIAPAAAPVPPAAASKIQIIPRKTTKLVPSHTPRTRVIHMEVTAYCPCKQCCGKQARGITASGKRVSHRGGKFVAADTSLLPFWTKLSIPGYHGGRPVEVLDRGGDIKGHRLDVFFKSHREAQQWGRRIVPVTVYQ